VRRRNQCLYNDELITVCYELLAAILKIAAAQDLPLGVSRADTIIGPVLDVFLHETGHAVFSMLQMPVLGRQEDVADQFSAYIMLWLSKDETRRMILGSAYHRAMQMPGPEATPSRDTFSDEHSTPAQRAYNVLCIAYGADKKLFADIVDIGPPAQAARCKLRNRIRRSHLRHDKADRPVYRQGRRQEVSRGMDQNRGRPARTFNSLTPWT
jgi:hypothetical protein